MAANDTNVTVADARMLVRRTEPRRNTTCLVRLDVVLVVALDLDIVWITDEYVERIMAIVMAL